MNARELPASSRRANALEMGAHMLEMDETMALRGAVPLGGTGVPPVVLGILPDTFARSAPASLAHQVRGGTPRTSGRMPVPPNPPACLRDRNACGPVPRLAAAWLACALGFLEPARAFDHHAQIDMRDGSGVGIEYQLLAASPASGFVPMRVEVTNRTSLPHRWEVLFESSSSNRKLRSNASVEAPAGETRTYDLLVPRLELQSSDYGYARVYASFAGHGVKQGSRQIPANSRSGNATPYVLMSSTVAASDWTKLETALKSGLHAASASPLGARFQTGRGSKRDLFSSRADLALLPPDQRFLSGVAAVYLTTADWQRLPAALRAVIRQWLIAGGRLFVAFDDPAQLTLRGLPLDSSPTPRAFGLGRIIPMKAAAGGELPVATVADAVAALDTAPFPQWQQDFEQPWPVKDFVGWPSLNVPLIIGFVVLFAVIIGPVNFMAFAPAGRRHRLFLTVPALSAVASVALVAIIILGDGVGGIGARNALVLLMAGENQASIAQEQIVRTRLLLSRGFTLPSEVAFAFIQLQENNVSIQCERSGDALGGDWFRSRSVQAHALRLNVPTRAEVVLDKSSSAAAPVLLSTVGAPLSRVSFVDVKGAYWSAAELPTGRPTPLQPSTREAHEAWVKKTTLDFSVSLREAAREIAHRPGWFYAEGAPAGIAPIETLRSIDWKRQTILCAGACERAAAGK